jgi:hypothetical protein
MNHSEDSEAEDRQALLQRLESQRQRMESLLTPDQPNSVMSSMQARGFPRSQTMRLLMNEPAILAGLASLAARAIGPKLMSIVRAFALTFRVARTMFGQRGQQAQPPPSGVAPGIGGSGPQPGGKLAR